MLWIGDKKVGKLYFGSTSVIVLYQGAVKVWEAISSCFGNGAWRSAFPWKGTDKWKST